jgi:hypothetical protein
MTKTTISMALLATAIMMLSCGTGSPTTAPVTNTDSDFTVTLDFSGPSVSPSSVYACWIENEAGDNVKNLYVCNSVVGIGRTLTGDALPFWKTVKYTANDDIDGITGASVQGSAGLSVSRNVSAGFPTKFRVYFEIDRSVNNNTYFGDRPSMIFRSELIDATSLSSSPYPLTAYAWMANGTDSGTYSQAPNTTIPGFATYKLMTDLSWIQNTTDMVSSLAVTVSQPTN